MFGAFKPRKKRSASRPRVVGEALSVHIADRAVSVRVRQDKRAQRFILRLAVDGTPTLTAPVGASEAEAQRVLDRHTGWLQSKLEKCPDRVPFDAGAEIPIRGETHLLVHAGARGKPVSRRSDTGQLVLEVCAPTERLSGRVLSYLKAQAKEDLQAASQRAAAQAGSRFSRVRIGDPKSRWGSCSSSGTLSYSWRVIMAPPYVLQYLAAHEVAHLTEMNHGNRFWRLCAHLADDMDRAQDWLKRHGRELHRYG